MLIAGRFVNATLVSVNITAIAEAFENDNIEE